MTTVIFYTKENCFLCDEALMYLKTLQHLHQFNIEVRDIYTNEQWLEKYHLVIPVIELNNKQIFGNDISLMNIEQFLTKNINC
ncbi:MAG TPA: glutaredoxin family protein [Bacillota bacterium]|nr:glutaredoxin family protein [Bacillota bacterium]